MVRIFLLPYLGNRSKLDPCSYELFCLESHILSFPKVMQIPPESPCIIHFNPLKSICLRIPQDAVSYCPIILSYVQASLSFTRKELFRFISNRLNDQKLINMLEAAMYYSLPYLLTPWSTVLLEKLTGSAASQ